MSMAALRWARGVRGIDSSDKLVLFLLADQANDAGECWPSVAGIAEDGCMGERTAQRALAALEVAGLIVRKGNGGRGMTRLYILQTERAEAVERVPSTTKRVPPKRAERVPSTPERVSSVPERVTSTTQKGVTVAPEPSRTPIEPIGTPNTRAEPRAVVVPLPAWLPPDAWDAWCQHRVAKSRKGWTHAAAVRCVATLEKLRDAGDDPREVIDQSIAGGWTGLFPLKNRSNGRGAENARPWWMEDMLRERH